MFVRTHRKIYELKFGLRGLILLNENSNLVMTEDLEFLVYCGLISSQPTITFQEVREVIKECDLSSFSQPSNLLSSYEIEELYAKAVGEIGMAPSDFYAATPEEINIAYEGYLRRKETEANLTKLALLTLEDGELIRLTEDLGYTIGNLSERNECFTKLNIREGLNNEL